MHRVPSFCASAARQLASVWLGLVVAAPWFGAALPAQGPKVELTTIDARVASGFADVTRDLVTIKQDDDSLLEVALSDVLSVTNKDDPVTDEQAPLFVWLRSGSRIPALKIGGVEAGAGAAARLAIDSASGARIEVPVSSVAAIRVRSAEPKTFQADREDPGLNLDYLYIVKDGQPQKFSVTIASIHDGKVHFDLRGSSYDFALVGEDSVAGVVFGKNTGAAPDRQSKPRVLLALATGERIEGKLLELGSEVRLRLDEGVEFEAPGESLQRLDVLSDKLTWLGSLQPKAEQTAAFDRAWPWTVNSSPAGPGILLGGKTYSRGLVMVPRTRLIYDVKGRYDVFEAVIGIDDRGGPQAHAIFRVLGDGKLLYESEPRVCGQLPTPIRVDLAKCQVLAIEADFGKNFDLGDLCAFADARVLQR